MRLPTWMFLLGFILFVGGTGLCSFLSYTLAREFVIDAQASGVDVPSFQEFIAAQPTTTLTPSPVPPTATATVTNTPPPGVTFTPVPTTNTLQAAESDTDGELGGEAISDPLSDIPTWADPDRITVLLMGIDQRTATSDPGPFRTDTMMLVQIDPLQETAGVLSIPRDLWVDIPGFQDARVNSANLLGDSSELPGGGPALAMETIYANLGVEVDYFVRLNFQVFTEVVDTLAPNGVEVCPDEAIVDDTYPDAGYGFITVTFDPGCQVLQSERLLQYARTRATQGSDFDRTRRQQEVIRALQDEVLSAGGVVNFITQIPRLYNDLTGNYVTNIPLDEALSMAQLVSRIGVDDVTYNTINNLHVTFGTSEDGQQILIPNPSSIQRVLQETFNPVTDITVGEMRERAAAENAAIVVYNNTDITGLAGQTRDWLTSRGVDVASVGNIEPPTGAPNIVIRDYTGNTWTTRYLAALMDLPTSAIRTATDGLTSADVMIVVGTDVQALLGTTEGGE